MRLLSPWLDMKMGCFRKAFRALLKYELGQETEFEISR